MSRCFALIAAERFYMKIECSNNGMCRKRSHDAKISIAQAPFRPRVHEIRQGRVCFQFHMVPAFLLSHIRLSTPPLDGKMLRKSSFTVSGARPEVMSNNFLSPIVEFMIPNSQIENDVRVKL